MWRERGCAAPPRTAPEPSAVLESSPAPRSTYAASSLSRTVSEACSTDIQPVGSVHCRNQSVTETKTVAVAARVLFRNGDGTTCPRCVPNHRGAELPSYCAPARTIRVSLLGLRVAHALLRLRGGRPAGNIRPAVGCHFPKQLAPFFELKRPAIRNALTPVERPYDASQDLRRQAEAPLAQDKIEVNARARPQGATGLHQGAARAQIDEMYDVARPERRVRDVGWRPAVAEVGAPILYGLTHDRDPDSYLSTRVRPVAPRTRTAYCACPPCRYSVPDVAVPSGESVRIRAVPIRTPSLLEFRIPSTSEIPIARPKWTPRKSDPS